MADIGEITVRITGDASDLAATLGSAKNQLADFANIQASSGTAGTKSLEKYNNQLKTTESTIAKSRKTLQETKKAYEDNVKSVDKNVNALKMQKSSIENMISAKKNEINTLENANKIVNKGSTAYMDNQRAIQWTTTELNALEKQHKKVSSAIQEQQNNLTNSKKAYEDAQTAVSQATKQYEEYEKGVKAAGKVANAERWQQTGKGLKEVGESIDTITKPIQYAATAALGLGAASAIAAVNFEDNFANVKKTVDGTPEELEDIRQKIIQLSTTGIDGHNAIPQTTAELTELAAAGGQLGITTDNIVDFTEVMAQMGSATNLVGEEGAATLARFQNVMGVGQNEIRNIGSAIVDLGNHSATTESEIASMALRMGKYGSSVRMSAADVLGYSAALSSLGIEAQMGGSAIGRTWLSIEKAVANGGEGLKAFAKYSGKSAKEFKEQWNTDSSGAFNGLLKGLQSAENLTVALDDLGINNTQDIQAMMALVNGYDLVTESVNRSNTAYKENTALQEEFDAKAETTASKLSVAKNNVVEIARSFGDLMLPTIVDVSNGVSQYTQKIASMDDAQKKNIITAGATVVAMGAITKGSTGLIKWAGNTVEAVGNIKKAFSAGGALAKFAPTLASIGAVAGPAVLSLGAMATATVVLYKAARKYEEYSKDWSRGGDELSNKTKSYADAARDLNSLQWELRNLQQVVNNPDTDETTLQQSKQRIEEIKNLLAEKYDMDISVNDAELDEAIEKMKRVNYLEAKQNIPDLTDYGNNKKDDYEDAKSSRELYNENVEGIKKQQQATADYRSELLMLKDAYDKGSVSQEEFNNKFNELSEATGNPNFKNSPIEALLNSTAIEDWSKELEKNLTNNNTLISENEATMAEYEKTMRELANAGLLEMEFGDTEQGLEHITTAVKNADLSMSDWATTAALVQTGQSSLDDVWQAGGDTLNNFISNYTADMQKFGASSNEIATKAALLQNGFRSIQEASEAGALDVVTKQANDLAHSMGLIPENKNIAINASGDISIIEDVQRAVDVVNGVGDVNLQVSAEGDISVLNTADSELQELVNNNQVTIKFNVDTGGFDINDLNGDKLGEITATGKVIWTNDSTEPDNYTAPPKEGNVTFTKDSAEPDGYQPEDKFATVHYTVSVEGSSIEGLSDKSAPAAKFGSSGMFVKKAKKAKGTQNFEGGLAMVNDEKGISDPRELIVDKGRAFIPQGKDVVLPLSKGAKVYTASQTKAIMSGMGIPHYATGKDNSDAFTSAKDDWTHYTKTHAVTTAQELEKWLEFQEKFKSNDKDIADIEEQIFSLTQKRTQELNNLSKSYIEERAALNDWDDNGDDPIDAFTRIRDRNMAEVEAGRMTWEDYTTEMSSIGSTLYDNMTEYSRDWLEHQEKYNGMSAADYIAGIGRIQTYTEQMYAQGIISHKEYVEAKNKLNDEYLDKRKEQIEKEYDISKNYISEHTYFNDWQDNGDSPLDAYNRVMDRHREELANGELTQDEFDKYQSELGSDMYSERVEQSKNWLEEQRKYYGMTDEEYIAGLKRIQQYTQEYYDLGLISRKEYNENMTELNHDMFDQAGESFDDMLQQQQDYINKLRDDFSAQEQALQDSWTVEDRKTDMSETQAQLDIYANAVTDRGQQKYKELQEQMKQLQRDEELYQLQVKNNATIEKLEAEYDALENSKADFIKSIATNIDSIDVTGIVADITQEVSGGNDKITKTLSEIIDAIKGIKIEQQNYNNNSKITINTTDSAVLGSYV
nr:MAG TPA: minor tail protein [Caudoviricetes sp.]